MALFSGGMAWAETLVFRNGQKLEVTQLTIGSETVSYTANKLAVSVPASCVDIEETKKLLDASRSAQKQERDLEKGAGSNLAALGSGGRRNGEKVQNSKWQEAYDRQYGDSYQEVDFEMRIPGGKKGTEYAMPFHKRAGLMVVDVTANGQAVDEFLVDTGASKTVITVDFAVRAGVAVNPSMVGRVSTANGSTNVLITVLRSLKVGNLTVENAMVFVSPTSTANLLGQNVLSCFTMSVDNQDQQVRLKLVDQVPSGKPDENRKILPPPPVLPYMR